MVSKSFGTQRPELAHLLNSDVGNEINDLRKDVEVGFKNSEGKTGFPTFDWIDAPLPLAAGGNVVLRGRNLLQGQTFDAITLVEGAASLVLTALKPGNSPITVSMVAGVGALSVAFTPSTGVMVITLASGGSTDNAIATAININAAPTDGYVRATSAGGGSFTLAQASAPFTGGVGDYAKNLVECSGVEALPINVAGTTSTAQWTDTMITVTVPVLTGLTPARAAGDVVMTRIQSNGVQTESISSVLA